MPHNSHNIKLLIAYDGTCYQGWQNSIEKVLKRVLEKICQHPIQLQAASRTDAGVHAFGQVANFTTLKELNPEKLQCSLNQLLPSDIVIRKVDPVSSTFHPTLHATGKEYRYYLCLGKVQLPHHRLYSWHIHRPLDLSSMHEGAQVICGKRDFSSFCNQGTNSRYSHYIREVTKLDLLTLENDRLCIIVQGNSFLYKMVRNIIGTLIYIGLGKIFLKNLSFILEACDRTLAGISAPAHGLFLHEVFFSANNSSSCRNNLF